MRRISCRISFSIMAEDSSARWLFARGERFLVELLEVSAQLLGILHHGSGMRVSLRPLAQLLAEAMDVVAGLCRESVFGVPDFLKDRISFHGLNLGEVRRECKLPEASIRAAP